VVNYRTASAYDSGEADLYLQTVPAAATNDVTSCVTDFQLTRVSPPTIQTNIPSI